MIILLNKSLIYITDNFWFLIMIIFINDILYEIHSKIIFKIL